MIRTILMMVLLTIALDAVVGLYESDSESKPSPVAASTYSFVAEHHSGCLSDISCEMSGHCHSPMHNRAFTNVIAPTFKSIIAYTDFYTATASLELPLIIIRPPIS